MTDRNRPADDSDIIDEASELPTPSQSGASGGTMTREIGQRDEDKTAMGGDPEPTSVDKQDKPAEGAASGQGKTDGGR